jgi:PAB1-binding protein PBP1
MYHHSKLVKNDFGYKCYEMPVRHFDHIQNAIDKKNFDYAINKKKRRRAEVALPKKEDVPSKDKGGIFQEVDRLAKVTPGPWTYDLNVKWMKGPNAKEVQEAVGKEKKKIFYKWKQTDKKWQTFANPKKKKQQPITDKVVRASQLILESEVQKVYVHRPYCDEAHQEGLSASWARCPLFGQAADEESQIRKTGAVPETL